MSIRQALLAATMLSLPAMASAQPVTGLYLGAGAGVNWRENPSDINLSGGTFGLPQNVTVTNAGNTSAKTGWGGVLSLGWGFGNGVRAEIEGNYRENEIDKIRGFGLAPFNGVGGFQRSYGVMANVFYDFDLANFGLGTSIIQPYIGGGVGYVWTDWHNVRGNSSPTGARFFADDSDGQFAYQAIAGVAAPLTWLGVTGLSLTAEYRFFGTVEPSINAQIRNAANVVVSSGKVEPDNFHHSIMLGLRYAFNQPAPPPPPMAAAPPPAAAPAPARTYLVFFDWDRADLTARAREIIAEAAQNARRVQSTRIEVAGHADRSGTPQYNQRLSQRRAEAVAAELVARGISRNEIAVTAFGESRPLVPTADGVREPQNRRVEIVLR
ncbi:OmpA family protein [Siccirubricoccus sp. G192]|uniref:OmpA family protein n=1 Tax=Siccirubricoccus sp. G192 TaxID=2849651 RepID=UPI001C2BF0C5|nr:OmpA family protein [Siccirubricoccus sp. G192]MBV1798025.1 OmpA family protein [Siccirubricoccus sp. G192]